MNGLYRRDFFYIGGQFQKPASNARIEVVSPSTEEAIGSVPEATPADIDAAVAAARLAARQPDGWPSWPVAERADALDRLADALDRRAEAMFAVKVDEVGATVGPPGASHGAPSLASRLLRTFTEFARAIPPDDVRDSRSTGLRLRVRRRPFEVVGAISPFNGALFLGLLKVVPAIASGATVVFKPPPQAPLEPYLLADALEEAGLPPGVVNVLPGGAEAGERLVTHPDVDRVAFTGSTAAGIRIAELCARSLKPVTLELGGKSAAILLEDLDLGAFIAKLGYLCYTLAGQNCYTNSRILVPRARYGEVVDAVAEASRHRVVGDPHDPKTEMGPVVSAAQRERIESYIRVGKEEGATLVTGGGRPSRLDRGFYLEPTVFAGADNSMRICQEEIFGPVVALIGYDDENEAVAIANDSQFGLAGTVWGADMEHAVTVAERVRTGTIGVNDYGIDFAAPFGGWKLSGIGWEFAREGLDQYSRYQTVLTPPV